MGVKDFFLLVHRQDRMEIVAEEARDPYEERAKHPLEYVGLDQKAPVPVEHGDERGHERNHTPEDYIGDVD